MDTTLRALADGTRRQILALVWRQERAAGDIAAAFAVTRPAISQHLKVLLESDLIQMRRDGTRRLYHANRRAVARLRSELATFWDNSLPALKHAAEETERRKGGSM